MLSSRVSSAPLAFEAPRAQNTWDPYYRDNKLYILLVMAAWLGCTLKLFEISKAFVSFQKKTPQMKSRCSTQVVFYSVYQIGWL
jgi:hypothetical protein